MQKVRRFPVNAGTYKVIFRIPADDATYTGILEVPFTIAPQKVTAPTVSGSYTYTGGTLSAEVTGVEATMVQSGTASATDAGTYTVTVALQDKANYVWDDTNDTADKSFNWTIAPKKLTVPTAETTEFTYDQSEKTLDLGSNYDSNVMKADGDRGTAAGEYTAVITLTDAKNYTWADGTTEAKTIDWSIKAAEVTAPTEPAVSEFTYDNSEQTFEPAGFAEATMTISGHKGTNAGSYTATVALKDKANYVWADTKTTADKSFNWSIAAKAVTITPAAAEKAYGETDPALTYTTGLSGDLAAAFEAAATGSLSRDSGEYAGEYAITLGSVTAGKNFTVSLAGGTVNFTIKAAAQTVAVPGDDVPLKVGKSIDLKTLVSSNADDKDAFSFEISGEGAALSGSTLTANADNGTITVTVKTAAVDKGGF